MVRGKLRNPIFLFSILVGYVIAQFSWWLYLIFSLYKSTYQDPERLSHKTWMLIGEGSVFLLILLGGVYIIRRAFKREREINQLQENFLQSVSHELKTPIASVGLFLETLQKRNLDEAKRKDIYQRALGEVNRLNHLISDILTARNIENANYYLHKEEVELKPFIESKINLFRDTLLKGFEVEFEAENITKSLDKEALTSILHNLLENARKYSKEGSKIKLTLKDKGAAAVISCIDEGPGIADEIKEKVFGKFYRAENEMTRKSKGTGLGLYITRYLVEKQGGDIKLKDNKPQGLIVEITFE